jgi:hypothetical protein
MPRRGSRSPFLLLVVALVIVAAYVAYKVYIPKGPTPFPSERELPQHERSEQERNLEKKSERRNQNRKRSEPDESCVGLGVICTSVYFDAWREPSDGACTPSTRMGYPVPDPACTPGGVNPTVAVQALRDPGWKTRCIRNCESSEPEKHVVYRWYGTITPRRNSGKNQVCELDHLVPLELGGADGLGNIWPECGPDAAIFESRYFKIKDRVEDYLADEVRDGRMSLGDAQRGIASDWTQYLDAARHHANVRLRRR